MAVNDIMISVFLSVAETKSFTKTANAMYLTQQAVSKNIARYEAHLGFKLFDRTTRMVVLTDAGNELYEFLRDSMGAYHRVIDHIKNQAKESDSILRIGIMERLSIVEYIAETESRLSALHPSIKLEWSYHPGHMLPGMLERGELDLFISFAMPKEHVPNHLRYMSILDSVQELLIASDYPNGEAFSTAKDLESVPLYLFQNVNSTGDPEEDIASFRLHHQTETYQPKNIQVLPSEADAKLAVKLGKGVTITNTRCEMAKDPALRAIPLRKNNDICCFWTPENPKEAV